MVSMLSVNILTSAHPLWEVPTTSPLDRSPSLTCIIHPRTCLLLVTNQWYINECKHHQNLVRSSEQIVQRGLEGLFLHAHHKNEQFRGRHC